MSFPRTCLGSAVPTLSTVTFPSMARRIGRLFPQAGNANLAPRVVAWPDASDLYGVAYPAGTVGVVWTNDHSDYSDAAILAGLQANAAPVPGSLPSGYTARLRRDRFPGAGSALSQLAGTHKVRTAAGFAALTWFPTLLRAAQTFVPYTGNVHGGADATSTLMRSGWVGWRGLSIEVTFFGGSSGIPYTGSATFNISHNADGSTPTADGDTIDATFTIPASDLTWGPSSGASSFHTLGQIIPTVGVASAFVVRATANTIKNNVGFSVNGIGITVQESYRADVPLPFTCTGFGGDIAPGGVIPGTVPGY